MSNGRNTSSRGEKKGSKTIKMIYDMIDEMAGEGSESGTSDQTTTPADCFKVGTVKNALEVWVRVPVLEKWNCLSSLCLFSVLVNGY